MADPDIDELTGPALSAAEAARLAELRELLAGCDLAGDAHPADALAKVVAAGFLADCVPAEHGGTERSITFAARAVEEVAVASPSLAWLLTIQYGLHFLLPTLTSGGGGEYFAEIATNGALLAGSHARSGLAVTRDGADLVVTGVLRYCSGAPVARWITTTADLPEGGGTVFIRDDTPGIRCEPSTELHGMRGSLTGFVHLDGVRVPPHRVHPFLDLNDPSVRPPACRYFGGWHSLLLQNAVFVGAARGAIAVATPILGARGGRLGPAGSALLEAALGAAATDLLQARAILYSRVGRLEAAALAGTEQRNAADPAHTALLSSIAALAFSAVSRLVEHGGGATLLTANPLEAYWRDVQLARVAEGTQRTSATHELGHALAARAR
ncbi:acyl-CoA dehydrogenase family protein [Actinoplanes sp. NPDC026619]|uniref:acyl-CoA dehydrogenase family protein n=1 Tax=Actinoplanes sp. NPDC026619 TaxID=3155798 RepID=UPI0033E9FB5C